MKPSISNNIRTNRLKSLLMDFGYDKDENNCEKDTPSLYLQIGLNVEKLERQMNKENLDRANNEHVEDKYHHTSSESIGRSSNLNISKNDGNQNVDSPSNIKLTFSEKSNDILGTKGTIVFFGINYEFN